MSSPPSEGGGPAALLERWGFSRQGWLDNRCGEWWLLGQLCLIAALILLPALPTPATLGVSWPLGLRLLGAGLLVVFLVQALRALLGLGASLTPLPEPIPGTPLVRQGPYSRCRHPVYQALLGFGLALALLRGSLLHLALLIALAAVLGGKARREERSLCQTHPDYPAYRASTAAIVPGLPWLDWRS
jgi:protein-S-isoprenylcysteine O-methyltransferase Ste14